MSNQIPRRVEKALVCLKEDLNEFVSDSKKTIGLGRGEKRLSSSSENTASSDSDTSELFFAAEKNSIYGSMAYPFKGDLLNGQPALNLTIPRSSVRLRMITKHLEEANPTFSLGGRFIEQEGGNQYRAMRGGTVFLGTTGSGKSIQIDSLLREALKNVSQGGRMVLFDNNHEYLPKLRWLSKTQGPFKILNFDPLGPEAEACQWDIKREIGDNFQFCSVIAKLMVPSQKEGSSSLLTESQLYVQKVLEALWHHKEKEWTFFDVIMCLAHRELGNKIIEKTEDGRAYLTTNRQRLDTYIDDIISRTFSPYLERARTWESRSSLQKVTIRDWAINNNGSVLLLPQHYPFEDTFTSVITSLASFYTLEKQERAAEEKKDLSWFFFDGLERLPKIEALPKLITEGQSKGSNVVFGAQSYSAIRSLYGDTDCNKLFSVANWGILNCDLSTYEMLQQKFGRYEFKETIHTYSETRSRTVSRDTRLGRQGSKTVTSDTLKSHETVVADVIDHSINTFRPNKRTGLPLYAYVKEMDQKLWTTTIPNEEVELLKIKIPQSEVARYREEIISFSNSDDDILPEFSKKWGISQRELDSGKSLMSKLKSKT